jgi:hypothetical protein
MFPFRNPATTWSSMSTTSSPSRRPFGNPALSPPITPKRFSVSAGGTPRFSFSVSTGTGLFVCWLRPGRPCRSAWTMSVRSVSGAPMSNRAFRIFASSGSTTYLP